MRTFLLCKEGFDAVYQVSEADADQDVLEDYMMNKFPVTLHEDDRLLFYYAGHGAAAGGDTGYMLFAGAKEHDFAHHVLAIDRVKEWSRVIRAKQILFLLDTCTSGLAFALRARSSNEERRLAVIDALGGKGSRIALTAGTETEETFEIEEKGHKNGVFTRAFLDAVTSYQENNGIVDVYGIYVQLEFSIAAFAKEKNKSLTPKLSDLGGSGTFLFFNPGVNDPHLKEEYMAAAHLVSGRGTEPVVDTSGCGGVDDHLRNPLDCLRYISVPAGEYWMGCVPSDQKQKTCPGPESPRHKVSITKGFFIGETEVTAEAYKRFVRQTRGRRMPDAPHFNTAWGSDQQPMVDVNWQQAAEYCSRLGGRLPTEAEWEYAARAGDEYSKYPWGDAITHEYANYGSDDDAGPLRVGKNTWKYTTPVRQFLPNKWGLYDMAGNVWQWTADCYDDDFYRKSPAKDPYNDPAGRSCNMVVRGGSWDDSPFFLRSSMRNKFSPAQGYPFVGFRCVLPSLNNRQ